MFVAEWLAKTLMMPWSQRSHASIAWLKQATQALMLTLVANESIHGPAG